jgi:uncharacterized protein YvpB
VGTIARGIGVIRRRAGLIAILFPLVAGCSLPNTGVEPTAAAAAAATPVSTPAVLDTAGVTQTAEAAFAEVPGGTSYYDCSFGGTLFDCPLTNRLRSRLSSAQIRLCSCSEGSPDRSVTATLDSSGRGVAHVRLYGGRLKLDLTVVPVGEELLIDDERLTGGGAESSIYAQPVELPAPRPPADPPPANRPPPPVEVFTVAVPVYQQLMNLDCETAALQMGLATSGHKYSQAELFALEAPDTRPAVIGPNKTVLRWGNPYTNFVGLVDGLESNMTGYGVYWPVMLQIAKSHGVPGATGGSGLPAKTVYQALKTGHAVEVWIETGWVRPSTGTWTSWDGRSIPYSLHEHAVTLSGVSNDAVRVNDPLHATQYWVTKATFEASWADFGNQALIF